MFHKEPTKESVIGARSSSSQQASKKEIKKAGSRESSSQRNSPSSFNVKRKLVTKEMLDNLTNRGTISKVQYHSRFPHGFILIDWKSQTGTDRPEIYFKLTDFCKSSAAFRGCPVTFTLSVDCRNRFAAMEVSPLISSVMVDEVVDVRLASVKQAGGPGSSTGRSSGAAVSTPCAGDHADSLLDPAEWVDKLFCDKDLSNRVLSVTTMKEKFGKSCIINNPEKTMGNPYLGAHLLPCVKTLRDASACPPDSRLKPLVVTVRGTGGGKTRLFEELRQCLNQDSGTVALSITFNHKTSYEAAGEPFVDDPAYVELNVILSVLLRITATAYNISLQELYRWVTSEVHSLNISMLGNVLDLQTFGHFFLQRIIRDIDSTFQISDSSSRLCSFYILVDEVMTVQDVLQGLGIEGAAVRFKTAISILSKVALNDGYSGREADSSVNLCLSISSLEMSITGKLDSGRGIKVLVLPERLDADEIVRQWWTGHLEDLQEVDAFRLKLVAETVMMQPRVVSFVSEFIKNETRERVSSREPFVDAAFVKAMYEDVLGKMESQYSFTTSDVDPSKLKSLIFGESIQLDVACTTMIRKSIFVNSFYGAELNRQLVPQGSLLMLAALYRPTSTDNREMNVLDPYYSFFMLFSETVKAISSTKGQEGATLESLTEWWLKSRIAVAAAAGVESIQLGQLFPMLAACDEGSLSVSIIKSRLRSYFVPAQTLNPKWPVLTNDPKTVNKFAKAFSMSKRLGTSSPLVMYESRPSQGFDQLLSFSVVEPGQGPTKNSEAFLLFLDEKSGAVRDGDTIMATEANIKMNTDESGGAYADVDPDVDTVTGNATLNYSNDFNQFKKVQRVEEELKRLRDEEQLKLSKEGEALAAGRYKFIYMATHPTICTTYNDNMMVCNKSDMKEFFGFMWSFVRASCSPSS